MFDLERGCGHLARHGLLRSSNDKTSKRFPGRSPPLRPEKAPAPDAMVGPNAEGCSTSNEVAAISRDMVFFEVQTIKPRRGSQAAAHHCARKKRQRRTLWWVLTRKDVQPRTRLRPSRATWSSSKFKR